MTTKRIVDYTTSSNVATETMFEIDRLTDSTGKISYVNLGLQLAEATELARTFNMTKIDDDTFAIKSLLYENQGINIPLTNMMLIDVAPFYFPVETFWQPNVDPKIKFNNGEAKSVYNFKWFNNTGSTRLDRNSFWAKGMMFQWREDLDAFLLIKKGYDTLSFFWSDNPTEAGCYVCNGTEVPTTNYPNFSTLYDNNNNNGIIPNMADASFCGYNYQTSPSFPDGITVAGVISDGCIDSNTTLNASLNGSFWVTSIEYYDNNIRASVSGNFTKAENKPIKRPNMLALYSNPVDGHITYPYGKWIQHVGKINIPSSINTTIQIGSGDQTLTKRMGKYCHRVL